VVAAAWPHAQRAALVVVVCAAPAAAADLGDVAGFDVQWETTLRATLGVRTQGADAALLQDINGDDGDRAFRPGVNSTRLDAVTEITAARGDLGFDVSAQGWYDPVYFHATANHSPYTFNPYSVPNTAFPTAVRQLMGGDAELLNAFVKDSFSLGDLPVTIRLGRQSLLWGESLFFAGNGIAAGQAPVDQIKALGAPLATARELYLPVTQAVVRVQLQPGLALEAYDQFEWRADRLPGVASYFSTTDILDAGGERYFLPNGNALYRAPDQVPHGLGQFGLALRSQSDTADFGLYALRSDAKLPVVQFNPAGGTYRLIYPRGVDMFGASASFYLGNSNLAGEISLRENMPLLAGGPGVGAVGGGGGVYAFYRPGLAPAPSLAPGGVPTGQTWHAQVSAVSQLAPGRWWQAASLQGELACNDLIAVTGAHADVQAGRTHFACSLRAVATPQYFQVLPGLDVQVPVGFGYTPLGRSSLDATQNAGTGDITLGVSATVRAVWQMAASYTHFIGGAGVQRLADRDFVSVSVGRSF
jgi:hypothetical protein